MNSATLTPELADWRLRGNCAALADLNLMFPGPRDEDGIAGAKAVCRSCPVKDECLEWANEQDIRHGVWAGLTAVERGRPSGKPRVVIPARTCECGAQFWSGRERQYRCETCSKKSNPGATKAPARVLARGDEIAAWKRDNLSDGQIARLIGCGQSSVTLARQNLSIGVDCSVRRLDAVAA